MPAVMSNTIIAIYAVSHKNDTGRSNCPSMILLWENNTFVSEVSYCDNVVYIMKISII